MVKQLPLLRQFAPVIEALYMVRQLPLLRQL